MQVKQSDVTLLNVRVLCPLDITASTAGPAGILFRSDCYNNIYPNVYRFYNFFSLQSCSR